MGTYIHSADAQRTAESGDFPGLSYGILGGASLHLVCERDTMWGYMSCFMFLVSIATQLKQASKGRLLYALVANVNF